MILSSVSLSDGYLLQNGALGFSNRLGIKAAAWLKAVRFQFYPMSFMAYWLGSKAASTMGYDHQRGVFWLGYAWLFLTELATVLSNDYFDYATDKNNKYFGPFTGGSRILVDKQLSFKEVKTGIYSALCLSPVMLLLLLSAVNGSVTTILATCSILFVLALGYTTPPLRLSYRGLGELTVGITHSFAVLVCGYIFQGGHIGDALPWLLGLPLFLSVLPSITLAGIPDSEADALAGKRTLAVRFGKKTAAVLALCFTVLAIFVVVAFAIADICHPVFTWLLYFALPHAVLLCFMLYQYVKKPSPPHRIDVLLIVALSYMIWFALIPLMNL